jgi:uncharacterized membrane-anchored protein
VRRLRLALLTLLVVTAQPATAQDSERAFSTALNRAFHEASGGGSVTALRAGVALSVPPGMLFLPKSAADPVFAAARRPIPSAYDGLLIADTAIEWFAVLQVLDRGHVDPREIGSWTTNDLIASLRDALPQQNAARVRQGRGALDLLAGL